MKTIARTLVTVQDTDDFERRIDIDLKTGAAGAMVVVTAASRLKTAKNPQAYQENMRLCLSLKDYQLLATAVHSIEREL